MSNKYQSFKQEMQEDLIPRIAEMIKKEKKHLKFLKRSKDVPILWIERSTANLEHLNIRYDEYIEYAKNLK